MSLGSFLANQWMMVLGGIAGLATAAIALFWSRYLVYFLLAVATIALGVFAATYPIPGEIDDRLPAVFLGFLRPWFFGLGLIALYSTAHLAATLVRAYSGPATDVETEGPFADIQSSWREILIQLSQARIDPAGQSLYLLLGPEESLATSLIDAAGLQLFARAPASAEAPIHCHAGADSLFLSCAGASMLGSKGAEGKARLEYLCRLIEEVNPERPILRGIAILIPFEWARGPDILRHVAAIRDDLEVIRRTLKVRCPTLTVCCLKESIPGLTDFASRLPADLRHLRCGFSVPISQGADGAVIRRGMIWMTRWFQVWSLNLMVVDIRDKDGNGRLVSMNTALRSGRDALIQLLETGLMVHQQAEPVLYRGCYFVACGSSPQNQAFAAGLLRGTKKGRLLADRDLTAWSHEADRLDRDYRRAAWTLGLASGFIAVLVWYFGIISRLAPLGQGAIGWAGLAALGSIWVVALRPTRRPRDGSTARS